MFKKVSYIVALILFLPASPLFVAEADWMTLEGEYDNAADDKRKAVTGHR